MQSGKMFVDLSGTDPDCAQGTARTVTGKAGNVYRRDDSRQRRAGGGHSQRAICHRHWRRPKSEDRADGRLSKSCGRRPSFACRNRGCPKRSRSQSSCTATTNNIITAEICSWLTAQGADPKLFLQLMQTTGSPASAARMEEFMKRNNNNGGALSNSYKDFRQALNMAAKSRFQCRWHRWRIRFKRWGAQPVSSGSIVRRPWASCMS